MTGALWPRTVVVLDCDGTIVHDRGYLDEPGGLTFLPGAAEGLRLMHQYGCRLVLITNQSRIGRGLQSLGRLEQMHERLSQMVAGAGALLEGIYYCTHSPEDNCVCRKPAQGLSVQVASELGFAISSVVVTGTVTSSWDTSPVLRRFSFPPLGVTRQRLSNRISWSQTWSRLRMPSNGSTAPGILMCRVDRGKPACVHAFVVAYSR